MTRLQLALPAVFQETLSEIVLNTIDTHSARLPGSGLLYEPQLGRPWWPLDGTVVAQLAEKIVKIWYLIYSSKNFNYISCRTRSRPYRSRLFQVESFGSVFSFPT